MESHGRKRDREEVPTRVADATIDLPQKRAKRDQVTDDTSPWDILVDDVILVIFGFLSPGEGVPLALACKRNHRLWENSLAFNYRIFPDCEFADFEHDVFMEVDRVNDRKRMRRDVVFSATLREWRQLWLAPLDIFYYQLSLKAMADSILCDGYVPYSRGLLSIARVAGYLNSNVSLSAILDILVHIISTNVFRQVLGEMHVKITKSALNHSLLHSVIYNSLYAASRFLQLGADPNAFGGLIIERSVFSFSDAGIQANAAMNEDRRPLVQVLESYGAKQEYVSAVWG